MTSEVIQDHFMNYEVMWDHFKTSEVIRYHFMTSKWYHTSFLISYLLHLILKTVAGFSFLGSICHHSDIFKRHLLVTLKRICDHKKQIEESVLIAQSWLLRNKTKGVVQERSKNVNVIIHLANHRRMLDLLLQYWW